MLKPDSPAHKLCSVQTARCILGNYAASDNTAATTRTCRQNKRMANEGNNTTGSIGGPKADKLHKPNTKLASLPVLSCSPAGGRAVGSASPSHPGIT